MQIQRIFWGMAFVLPGMTSTLQAQTSTTSTTPAVTQQQPPPNFAPPQGIRPTDKANANFLKNQQEPVNGFLLGGMTSPFGTPQDRTFHTPVGPPGAKANVFDQPSTAYYLQQQQLQRQQPGFWQRIRTMFGLGDATVQQQLQPGAVQQPILPPGSADPKVFGGR